MGRDVDRVPFIKVFGSDNAIVSHWEEEYPGIGNEIDRLLGFEGPHRGWRETPVNVRLTNLGEPQVTKRDDGAQIRRWADGTAQLFVGGFGQIIEHPVKTRDDWERVKRYHLAVDDAERFPSNWQDLVAEYRNRDYPLQLSHAGVYGFPRVIMGDEALAYAFYDDPELVHDMMEYYTDLALNVWEKMVVDVEFDLIEVWEDMASKNGALISPSTFREFMKPQYEKIAEFADKHGVEIILVDSDGFIENLTELMLEAGVTAMYPYEVQAGNSVSKMLETHTELGTIGGLNKNVMAQGKDEIDREMQRAAELIRMGRFIPGPDHFVLSDVPFGNYRYFMESLREVVMTTKPGS